LLGVYTGTTVSGLTTVASNDNDAAGGVTSALTLTATAGTTYRIAVDGAGGATGSIVLTINPIRATSVLYTTTFETSEGYSNGNTALLSGQKGWVSLVSGGNGFRNNGISGQGHQAFVGKNALSGGNTSQSVWQPLNFTPTPGDIITFSALTRIVDSGNGNYDLFRWEFWNLASHRLFSFEFNNQTNAISYILDDGLGPQATTAVLDNNHVYAVAITMDCGSGTWSASLDASAFNGDKRVLAFSDSVQDAAHRAGFIAARAYRTSFRTALTRTVQEHDQQGRPPARVLVLPRHAHARRGALESAPRLLCLRR
jgi:hypothetical protein